VAGATLVPLRASASASQLQVLGANMLPYNKGADVNAQGRGYSYALQLALYRGHKQIVKMLLDKGADVNAQGGDYGNALQAAS
jgi:ankyrin repeat protein